MPNLTDFGRTAIAAFSAAAGSAAIAAMSLDSRYAGMLGAAVTLPLAGRISWAIWGVAKDESDSAARDVKDIVAHYRHYQPSFDPLRYMQKCPDGHIFAGLTACHVRPKPVYLPIDVFHRNHAQLLGVSGTGKSSLAGPLLGQLTLSGDSVIVFDPKPDRRLPGVLARFAKVAKVKMHVVDLRPTAPAQINPLLGARADEVEELLQAAFNLDPSGDPAVDYHRGNDRDATLEAARKGALSIPELMSVCAGDPNVTSRDNFWRELRMLAQLPAYQTREGHDLQAAIKSGDVIYVMGSCENQRVITAQKLLLQRVLQIIKNRSQEDQDARQVCLFLDELKYLLSNSALRAAGVIRDRGCNLIVAHQSIGDLHDCPGLRAEAVIGAIHGNTSLKFCFRVEEPRTARDLSEASSTQRVWSDSIKKTKDIGQVQDGAWQEKERPHVAPGMLTNLPKPGPGQSSVAYVYGLGPAFLLASHFVAGIAPPPVVLAPPIPAARATENPTHGSMPSTPAKVAAARIDDLI